MIRKITSATLGYYKRALFKRFMMAAMLLKLIQSKTFYASSKRTHASMRFSRHLNRIVQIKMSKMGGHKHGSRITSRRREK